jgi:hypothetical protein
MSLWGEMTLLGQTEQSQSPAIWSQSERTVAAWIGADQTGVHQDIRVLSGGTLSDRVVLPLPPVHPYEQQIAPALGDAVHFLWLDLDDPSNETRLFSAYVGLSPTPHVERGPIRVSDQRTLRYAIVPNPDGSLWAVWSGGLLSEPSLYAQYLDPLSRPQPPRKLIDNADSPALARANDGTVYLFWLQAASPSRIKTVYRAHLGDGVIDAPQAITQTPPLNRGDQLMDLRAGLDAMHGYLIWNVQRADGTMETWLSSGALSAKTWSSPTRLGVQWTTKTTFETGFNGGAARPALAGDHWLRWASPAAGQFDLLPLAAQVDDSLALVYLRGGAIVGYQEIAPLSLGLIGAPALLTGADRHFTLAWSQPTSAGAELKVTSTRG